MLRISWTLEELRGRTSLTFDLFVHRTRWAYEVLRLRTKHLDFLDKVRQWRTSTPVAKIDPFAPLKPALPTAAMSATAAVQPSLINGRVRPQPDVATRTPKRVARWQWPARSSPSQVRAKASLES